MYSHSVGLVRPERHEVDLAIQWADGLLERRRRGPLGVADQFAVAICQPPLIVDAALSSVLTSGHP